MAARKHRRRYALGVSAFEMLLGHAPLTEPDSVTLIARLMDKGLPSPRELIPALPPGVSRLLDRMLHRDPKARCRSATEVLDEVRRARAELAPA